MLAPLEGARKIGGLDEYMYSGGACSEPFSDCTGSPLTAGEPFTIRKPFAVVQPNDVLTPDTLYAVVVRAKNSEGFGWPSELRVLLRSPTYTTM